MKKDTLFGNIDAANVRQLDELKEGLKHFIREVAPSGLVIHTAIEIKKSIHRRETTGSKLPFENTDWADKDAQTNAIEGFLDSLALLGLTVISESFREEEGNIGNIEDIMKRLDP